MLRCLLVRLAQTLLLLALFVSLTFFILQAMPGDIAGLFADPRITPEAKEAMRRAFGLNRPIHAQYFHYLKSVLSGDLGVSFSHYPRPVGEILLERLPRTALLFVTATTLSFYLGFALGKATAGRRGAADAALTAIGITFWTMFYPLLALALIWLFSYTLGWLPLNQFVTPRLWLDAPTSANAVFLRLSATGVLLAAVVGGLAAFARRRVARPASRRRVLLVGSALALAAALAAWARSELAPYALDILRHMALPILTLTLINFGGAMLLTRDAMLHAAGEDHVLAARAKGLPAKAVRDRHIARTALLPVVTSFALNLGGAVGGGVLTETLFSWPGLGLTLLNASVSMDYPLAIGAFLLTGAFVLVAHLVADVLHALLDPRLRRPGNAADGEAAR